MPSLPATQFVSLRTKHDVIACVGGHRFVWCGLHLSLIHTGLNSGADSNADSGADLEWIDFGPEVCRVHRRLGHRLQDWALIPFIVKRC